MAHYLAIKCDKCHTTGRIDEDLLTRMFGKPFAFVPLEWRCLNCGQGCRVRLLDFAAGSVINPQRAGDLSVTGPCRPETSNG